LDENKLLKTQIEKTQEINLTNDLILLKYENDRIKKENLTLIKKYNSLKKRTKNDDLITYDDVCVIDTPLHVSKVEIEKYGNVIKSLKKNIKNKQGLYNINGVDYELLEGTRQEVWDGKAYQTAGTLHKHNLTINKNGNIVSKKKCIQATIDNRFIKHGVNLPVQDKDILT